METLCKQAAVQRLTEFAGTRPARASRAPVAAPGCLHRKTRGRTLASLWVALTWRRSLALRLPGERRMEAPGKPGQIFCNPRE
jgi:hypothetical protein